MEITTALSDPLGRYLDLAAAQVKITAGNMANVDTPGYRTLGFDFDAEMRRAMAEASGQHARGASSSAYVRAGDAAPHLEEIDGLLERPDGNNVSMDREGLNLAKAQLQFRTGVEILKREYTRVLDAIHADGK